MAINRVPSKSVTFREVVELAASTEIATVSVVLHDFTVSGATPDMFFLANLEKALDAGLAIAQPYCVTAGHVIVPIINPTAGAITTAAATPITLIAL